MKERLYNGLYCIRVELFTREHVQVQVIIFFNKVSHDVRGFDELNESVPRLVSGAKVNYLRFAVWNHTNLLDKVIAERLYVTRTANGLWAATGRVDDSMQTPFHYSVIRDYSNQSRLLF
jgi:hypothetical protein